MHTIHSYMYISIYLFFDKLKRDCWLIALSACDNKLKCHTAHHTSLISAKKCLLFVRFCVIRLFVRFFSVMNVEQSTPNFIDLYLYSYV